MYTYLSTSTYFYVSIVTMSHLAEYPISDENCPVRRSLAVIGGKWPLLIIFQIGDRTLRFAELRRHIPGISEKMLSSQLQFLAEKGIVHRKSYEVVPPKVEYSLTKTGKDLIPILDQIANFGLKNLK
jgi:DNA-binding HxlR family transcriptional regulator